MSDDASALPWTPQQWATLRGVIQEAARKSRVASTFLPIEKGPLQGTRAQFRRTGFRSRKGTSSLAKRVSA